MDSDLQNLKNLAAHGGLRVALNFGNPVLAKRHPETRRAYGVSIDLARELARQLQLDLSFIPYEAAGHVFADVDNDVWDLAFMAIDPTRAERISFTQPYVQIEGTYMVRADSPLQDIADVDRQGVRIAVGKGAAYDLFLSRHLNQAQLVRVSTSAAAIDAFVEEDLEAVAGVRQPLTGYATKHDGFRVMPGRFTAIEQAMAVPHKHRSVCPALDRYLGELKRSGFVAEALVRSGESADVAAP